MKAPLLGAFFMSDFKTISARHENFNSLNGQNYYEGLAIFPTGGLKFEF
jgi:hypothetical protein